MRKNGRRKKGVRGRNRGLILYLLVEGTGSQEGHHKKEEKRGNRARKKITPIVWKAGSGGWEAKKLSCFELGSSEERAGGKGTHHQTS